MLSALMEAEATFTERPEVVPGDLRAPWRVALLTLLLDRCHGKSATMEQVHVMGWALLEETTRERMRAAMAGDVPPDAVLVRYDPAWARAIDLAVGWELAEWVPSSGRVKLSSLGRLVASALWNQSEILVKERAFLQGLSISQAMIDRLLDRAS